MKTAVGWAALALFSASCTTVAPLKRLDIDFCNIDVPMLLRVGRASFSAYYRFSLDERGKPKDIDRVRDHPLDDAPFTACIARWSFFGLPLGSPMRAEFHWEHGAGWTYIEVSGGGFAERISVTGNRCPYPPPVRKAQ